MPVRVLLADDHADFREVVRDLLESDPDITVVAAVGDGCELLQRVPQVSPDVVCLDVSMPGLNGLQATQALLAADPHLKVIAISGYADETYVQGMLNAGASGYVLKDDVGEHLIPAIRSVRQNQIYLCPQVMPSGTHAPQGTAATIRLEPREHQVLRLIGRGHDRAAVAEQLNMSRATVDVHCRNIMRKFDLNDEAELMKFAVAHLGNSTDNV